MERTFIIHEAFISEIALNLIKPFINEVVSKCNDEIKKISGITDFFISQTELDNFKKEVLADNNLQNNVDRSEYGDFQTNKTLALDVCQYLFKEGINPITLIEPTCGEGNFIVSALKTFPKLKKIIGVEIYKPYTWQTKFSILHHFATNETISKPEITIHHKSVFDFKFEDLKIEDDLLIIGNPPWVTNAMLSTLESDNLPRKSNFKNHSGLDAMTGKANFDIGEYISLMLIKAFENRNGHIALLVKNAVIKNIIQEQKRNKHKISEIKKLTIDSKKEFNVSVEAALFFAKMGENTDFTCQEFNYYTQIFSKTFGWFQQKFVSNLENYQLNASLDNRSPFEWRQGIKHDCSKVMEFEKYKNGYINGKETEFEIEKDLVYGLLKSSDLKGITIQETRKFTIVTQKKIGQATSFIKEKYPQTWQYLENNKEDFEKRKSSIYIGKPQFSIFGVGDYSFLPFKVAISGLYKNSIFSLILPQENKPIMLDDTCYFIGFEDLLDAKITLAILNSKPVQAFIASLVFWDSKRAITKELLNRIDIATATKNIDYQEIIETFPEIEYIYWERFKQKFEVQRQLTIF